MAADGKTLQQRGTLSHGPTRRSIGQGIRCIFVPVRLGASVGIDAHAVGLEGLPVDEARMVVANQHRPLIAEQPA